MSLDAYANFVDIEDVIDDFHFKNEILDTVSSCGDWDRKYKSYEKADHDFGQAFWKLHDYMEDLWKKKGGHAPGGFCDEYVRLTKEDLLKLKDIVFIANTKLQLVYEDEHMAIYKKIGMPDFFDSDKFDIYDALRRQQNLLEFIDLALKALDENKAVYYYDSY